ncbi:MAG: hypothetical protein QMC77_05555 [Methanocellales archaeon]|nr:hypothetical protein [Methanocellales archaeon]
MIPQNLICKSLSQQKLSYDKIILHRHLSLLWKEAKKVIADGGTRYPDALQRLGIRLKIVSGDIRNYIERWYKTFKGRIKAFDKYFPHKEKYNHIKYWVNAFVFYYNFIRRHMSLGNKTPMEYHEEVLN